MKHLRVATIDGVPVVVAVAQAPRHDALTGYNRPMLAHGRMTTKTLLAANNGQYCKRMAEAIYTTLCAHFPTREKLEEHFGGPAIAALLKNPQP